MGNSQSQVDERKHALDKVRSIIIVDTQFRPHPITEEEEVVRKVHCITGQTGYQISQNLPPIIKEIWLEHEDRGLVYDDRSHVSVHIEGIFNEKNIEIEINQFIDQPARKASTGWIIREIKKRENVATSGSTYMTLQEGIALYMAKASVKCLNDTIRKALQA